MMSRRGPPDSSSWLRSKNTEQRQGESGPAVVALRRFNTDLTFASKPVRLKMHLSAKIVKLSVIVPNFTRRRGYRLFPSFSLSSGVGQKIAKSVDCAQRCLVDQQNLVDQPEDSYVCQPIWVRFLYRLSGPLLNDPRPRQRHSVEAADGSLPSPRQNLYPE
jgi:hypothetical protein